MKIRLIKASDFKWEEIREINTLDDLEAICVEYGQDLIFSEKNSEGINDVWIYDDYME